MQILHAGLPPAHVEHRFFARYVMFAAITIGVLSVPPVVLWVDPWSWEAPEIFFMVAINFALAVFMCAIGGGRIASLSSLASSFCASLPFRSGFCEVELACGAEPQRV